MARTKELQGPWKRDAETTGHGNPCGTKMPAAGQSGSRPLKGIGCGSTSTGCDRARSVSQGSAMLTQHGTDFGSVVRRRSNQGPPEKGGWNVFFTLIGDNGLIPNTNPSVQVRTRLPAGGSSNHRSRGNSNGRSRRARIRARLYWLGAVQHRWRHSPPTRTAGAIVSILGARVATVRLELRRRASTTVHATSGVANSTLPGQPIAPLRYQRLEPPRLSGPLD
jgi:hypothetical protein